MYVHLDLLVYIYIYTYIYVLDDIKNLRFKKGEHGSSSQLIVRYVVHW